MLAFSSESLERIFFRVVHRCGGRHWRRIEVLNLVRPETISFEPQRQIQHVFISRTRVTGDEIRDEVLLFPSFCRELVEHCFERIVGPNTRLHHFVERTRFGMFWRNLQIASDMLGD